MNDICSVHFPTYLAAAGADTWGRRGVVLLLLLLRSLRLLAEVLVLMGGCRGRAGEWKGGRDGVAVVAKTCKHLGKARGKERGEGGDEAKKEKGVEGGGGEGGGDCGAKRGGA